MPSRRSRLRIRVGVEWVNKFPLKVSGNPAEPVGECQNPDLRFCDRIALGFSGAMGLYGHQQVFAWGNDDAWADDFRHNDFDGDSLNWSDNVHFCYFSSHGGQFPGPNGNDMYIGFASQHTYCMSSSLRWRLGAGMLKWLVLDTCEMVLNTAPADIVAVWGRPMQGVHLIFGFIGIINVGEANAGRGAAFAHAASAGQPLANAWLDSAYSWRGDGQVSRPIAIAAGVSRDDAINRRENETLAFRNSGVESTRWLAWKWRG
jgi:hypothetical protein